MRDALPHASFIGFTGTPIEKTDANTRAVFGDYISVYDIQRAVEDKATVPIYYESRLAKLELESGEPEESTLISRRLPKARKWSAARSCKPNGRIEASSAPKSGIGTIAKDLVQHFEERLEAMDGKAMVVCMSRRICVDLYKEIAEAAARLAQRGRRSRRRSRSS